MLYREDYYDADSERPGEMHIIVRKNCQGPLGQVNKRPEWTSASLPADPARGRLASSESRGGSSVRLAGRR